MGIDKDSFDNLDHTFQKEKKELKAKVTEEVNQEFSGKVYVGSYNMQKRHRSKENQKRKDEIEQRLNPQLEKLEGLHFKDFGGNRENAKKQAETDQKIEGVKDKWRARRESGEKQQIKQSGMTKEFNKQTRSKDRFNNESRGQSL